MSENIQDLFIILSLILSSWSFLVLWTELGKTKEVKE